MESCSSALWVVVLLVFTWLCAGNGDLSVTTIKVSGSPLLTDLFSQWTQQYLLDKPNLIIQFIETDATTAYNSLTNFQVLFFTLHNVGVLLFVSVLCVVCVC